MTNGERAVTGRARVHALVLAALAHRWQPLGVAVVGMLLTLPALGVGLVGDDYYHRAVLHGSRTMGDLVPPAWDMFSFFDGDPQRMLRWMDRGFPPWWTYLEVKAAFWRPLTVATHVLDYRLWSDCPALMHAQSIAWYGVLIAVVALLYRRMLGPTWVAGLAGLLFAVDDAHAMPVGFLANRNTLLAALLGVLALLAHDRWRQSGRRRFVVLAAGLLALSLLAKEEGVATCAYLAAYALFLDRGLRWSRLRSLLPYVVVVIAWRLLWAQLGYGVQDIGFYVDPLREPGRFAATVVERVPFLVLGQWGVPPADVAILGDLIAPGLYADVYWLGIGTMILLALVLIPLLRRDRTARFWALGSALALLPSCSTFPADRMLVFVGIGALGLLAQLLASVFSQTPHPARGTLLRAGAVGLAGTAIAIHLVLAPVALAVRVAFPLGPPSNDRFSLRMPLDAAVEQQDLIVVNPPSLIHVAHTAWDREFRGLPVARRMHLLADGPQAVEVLRTDLHTLVVRPERGWQSWRFESLLRDDRHPMHVGERVELTGLTVEVAAVSADGRPLEAAFRFAVPLEDPSLRWLCWRAGAYEPFAPPAVGETSELPYVGTVR